MSSPESRPSVVVADVHPLVDAIAERPDPRPRGRVHRRRDAVAQILARRPDAALLDMRMHDLDGMAVLEEIARAGSRTRVVFLSALSAHAALLRPAPDAERRLLLRAARGDRAGANAPTR